MNSLNKYNEKRNFKKTHEPIGKKDKSSKKLKFCVQHHIARKDHYDFRLEFKGVMLSWAIPKGPSYNTKDKRLAVHVEDHPLSYRSFEGIIPEGEYGAGTVMVWDQGYYTQNEDFNKTYKKGYLKFTLHGKRLNGAWTLVHFKKDNWLMIKENDGTHGFKDILEYSTSIKTNRTMEEIKLCVNKSKKNVNKKDVINITVTNPDKVIYKKPKVTKQDVINYYEKVYNRMEPFIKDRLISTVRCPKGIDKVVFFKKHFEENKNLKKKKVSLNNYYYIDDINGLISEVQMNSIEFHIWGSSVNKITNPDYMIFDLDPDEKLSISKVREGVKDLKRILDELELVSYLKTSGGKGYHVVIPIKQKMSWHSFRKIAKQIAELMESKWPDKYTSNMRKEKRKGKIFIDWVRNTKGATSVAPYSLRARKGASVSMPIKWSELDKIKPNDININEALKRLTKKDPWKDFFK